MAVDCAGNLYVSGRIYSPTRQNLGSFSGGTNLAFGGPDGTTVLVVGRGTAVQELKMNVPGLP
jgi:sugar lactone lactonase YvrE